MKQRPAGRPSWSDSVQGCGKRFVEPEFARYLQRTARVHFGIPRQQDFRGKSPGMLTGLTDVRSARSGLASPAWNEMPYAATTPMTTPARRR